MATPVIESTSSNTVSTGSVTSTNSLVIPKPTGLTIGESLITVIAYRNTSIISVPSGFNIIKSSSGLISYSKIADSGDVSASNFTFTSSSGYDNSLSGMMFRVSGLNLSISVLSNDSTSYGVGDIITLSSITPSKVNSLLLMASHMNSNNSGTQAHSYTIATSNPSWTDRMNVRFNTYSTYSHFFLGSAIRPEVTNTGNGSLYAQYCNSGIAQFIVISSRLDYTTTVSETITSTELSTYLRNRFFNFSDIITTTESYLQSLGRLWRKATKPVTTWINKTKN